jgi:Uma2 family endonuclease
VEVRSPGQSIQVLRDKCAGYLAAGVAECWLIDPEARTLERLPIGDGELLDSKATLVSSAMPEFELPLGEFFALLDQ